MGGISSISHRLVSTLQEFDFSNLSLIVEVFMILVERHIDVSQKQVTALSFSPRMIFKL